MSTVKGRGAMVIYDLKNASGDVFAFEVDHVGRRKLADIVRTIPGVRVTRSPKLLSYFREEDFCEFEVAGVQLIASEPFGDNSRLWIGPKSTGNEAFPEFRLVRETFLKA